MKKNIKSVIAMVIMLLFCLSSYGQSVSSCLCGCITDEYGYPLEGAVIIVTCSSNGERFDTLTDKEGIYRINNINAGNVYRMKVRMLGYNSLEITDINLPIGKECVIGAKMISDGGESTNYTVKKDFSKDRCMNSGLLETLPMRERSLRNILQIDPKVNVYRGIYISGEQSSYSALNFNGIRIKDDFIIPVEAVSRIAVSEFSYDITNTNFTGGSVDVISRSGSNKFEVSAYSYFTGSDLAGNKVGQEVFTAQKSNKFVYGAATGGYIIKNKLFFFLNGEKSFNDFKVFGSGDWHISRRHKLGVFYVIKHDLEGNKDNSQIASARLDSRFMDGKLTNALSVSYSRIGEKYDNFTLREDIVYSLIGNNILLGFQYIGNGTDSDYNSFSAYLSDNVFIGKKVMFTAGVRGDFTQKKKYVLPGFALEWDILGDRRWLLSGGSGLYAAVYPEGSRKIWKNYVKTGIHFPCDIRGEVCTGYNKSESGHLWSVSADLEKAFNQQFSFRAGYVFHHDISYGGYVIPHNISASFNYRKEYLRNMAAGISVFYNGGIQSKFTYIYSTGKKEGLPVYIPRSKYSVSFKEYYYEDTFGKRVLYTAEDQIEDYYAYQKQDRYLDANKGKYAEINGAALPWVNSIDVRISQDFSFDYAGRKNTIRLSMDVFNLANIFNSGWRSKS